MIIAIANSHRLRRRLSNSPYSLFVWLGSVCPSSSAAAALLLHLLCMHAHTTPIKCFFPARNVFQMTLNRFTCKHIFPFHFSLSLHVTMSKSISRTHGYDSFVCILWFSFLSVATHSFTERANNNNHNNNKIGASNIIFLRVRRWCRQLNHLARNWFIF